MGITQSGGQFSHHPAPRRLVMDGLPERQAAGCTPGSGSHDGTS